MLQKFHKLFKRSMLPQLLLLQINSITQLLIQNVLVPTKINNHVVHAGHSQLQLHFHKVDVYKVQINRLFNIHKNMLLNVIQWTYDVKEVG